jgi:hypothetical protein
LGPESAVIRAASPDLSLRSGSASLFPQLSQEYAKHCVFNHLFRVTI